MKKSEKEVVLLATFAAISTICSAVLTGYVHQDITEDRKFGCTWQGGISSTVTCVCGEEAEEMYITENSISSYDTSTIQIIACKKLKFGTNSINAMRNLRNIHLRNIENLEFEKSSLIWYGYRNQDQYDERYDMSIPSLGISVENSTISQISSYTFEGRINTIYFDGVTIENIEPFAFTSLLQSQHIIIKNSELKNIRLQPFKKLNTEILELNGVKAQLLPSRLFSNITVYNKFTIKNCKFDNIKPGAFVINGPKHFEVTNTEIGGLDGDAFKMLTRGNVLFKNNTINVINDGAFQGIRLNREEAISDKMITFDSNSVSYFTRNSFEVSNDFYLNIFNLQINQNCDCTSIESKIKNSEIYSEVKCLYDNNFVTLRDYKSNMCSLIRSYSTTIIIVGVILTLCVIIATVLVVYYKKVHNAQKYGSEKNGKKNNNLSLIVPDGRTYRETELHVIVERADLLTTDL